MSSDWTTKDIPDQSGKVAVVTGANSGLGYHTALELARKGAKVVLACRNLDKTGAAIKKMKGEAPGLELRPMPLDLADLSSVQRFSELFDGEYERLDLLVNNAGVMALPPRQTADGFEMQLGTNHLGHFALTGRLLPRLLAADHARVVTVTSIMHRMGKMYFDDLDLQSGYEKWKAYGQSKLANLLFAYELHRRFVRAGCAAMSVASHPGYTRTNLQRVGPEMEGATLKLKILNLAHRIAAQEAPMGALPTLYAATARTVSSGDLIGPGGFMELWGHPVKVQSSARSHDEAAAARLWEVSEERTGVTYDALGTQSAA